MATKSDGHVIIAIDADDKGAEKALAETKRKLDALGGSADDMSQDLKASSDAAAGLASRLEDVDSAGTKSAASLASLSDGGSAAADGVQDLSTAATDTAESLDEVDESADKAGDGMDSVGDSAAGAEENMLALNVGLAAVSATLIATLAVADKVSTEFDAAFAKTMTIMDRTAVSAQTMREDILDLSEDSAMAATNVSEAVYQAISGSVDTADAVGFVNQANQLAVAGFTTLTNSTDVLTTVLNAYGLKASAVAGISNVLIQTQNLGKTSVDDLAGSMGRAISTGSAYGVNLENLATSYVELTRGGIATAEATTYLSGMLNELGNAGSNVGKVIKDKTGSSFGELMQQGWSLGDVLQVLSDSVGGNAEALMGLWQSQEAGKASNAIMTIGIQDFNNVLAQMNREMAGTTGTTEAAYATMTNTSDFINKRLSNSVENLGIAFGDGLRPALDAVKGGLAGFAEGLTEFVQENPWAVAAVTSLATAVTVLAVGYTGLLVAKKAAVAIKALNLALKSNPFILVASAVAAVVVGLGTLIASAGETSEEYKAMVDEMTEASSDLRDVLDNGEDAMNDSVAAAEGAATVARTYVDRLVDLESQTTRTAAETEEYRILIDKLRTLMPDLNLAIDEQTGLLVGGADALQYQIDNWYELAVAQAKQKYVTDLIEKQAAAEGELATNQAKLNILTRERADIVSKLAAAEDELSELNTATASDFDSSAVEAVEGAIEDLEDQLDSCDDKIEATNESIETNKSDLAEAAETVEYATVAYDAYIKGQVAAADATESSGAAAAQAAANYTEAANAFTAAYNDAHAAAYASITGQMGLWGGMEPAVKSSVDGIISNLDSQIAYMDTYQANLAAAVSKGLDEGLVQKLSDGSRESAEILAGLATASEEKITEFNDKFAAVEEGKQTFADGLTQYSGVLGDETAAMITAAEAAGDDISAGLTDALKNGLPAFRQAIGEYGVTLGAASANAGAAPGSTVPGYATGTSSAAAGYAVVGEEGPELVYFAGGERVVDAAQTRELLRQSALRATYPVIDGGGFSGGTAQTIARGGHITATIVVPLSVDGREFARATAEYIGEEMDFEVM